MRTDGVIAEYDIIHEVFNQTNVKNVRQAKQKMYQVYKVIHFKQ